MKKKQNQQALAVCLLALFAAGTHFIRPDLSEGHDAKVYLNFVRLFEEEGLRANFFREPLYPLFLLFIKEIGFEFSTQLALVQNSFFLFSLFFFLRTLLKNELTRFETLISSLLIALIPSFWVTLNGALYTESLSASLVLIQTASIARFIDGKRNFKTKWLFPALLSSCFLSFNKGSFIYIHLLFPFVVGVLFFAFRKNLKINVAVLVGVLLCFAFINRLSISLWFGARPGEPAFSKRVYGRGGEMVYGRAEFARQFNFYKDTTPYLLNALSEGTCHKILGSEKCLNYDFNAENRLGQVLNSDINPKGYADTELFKMGRQIMLKTPFRQVFFGFFELVRFISHHSMNGFAKLQMPALGDVVHSKAFTVLLKIFNLLLITYIPWMLFWNRRNLGKLVSYLRSLDNQVKVLTLLFISYMICHLGAHMLVTTLVRMVFPIAPLLVILNWQAYRAFKVCKFHRNR